MRLVFLFDITQMKYAQLEWPTRYIVIIWDKKRTNKAYPNTIKLRQKGPTLDTITLAIIKRHSVTYSGGVLIV